MMKRRKGRRWEGVIGESKENRQEDKKKEKKMEKRKKLR